MAQDIAKITVQAGEHDGGRQPWQADKQLAVDVTGRMVIAVEGGNFLHRLIEVACDFEQMQIAWRNKARLQHVMSDKGIPVLPIRAVWASTKTTGISELLPVCSSVKASKASSCVPKPPGRSAKGVGFLYKNQLSGKKVFEIDQLWIIGDNDIGRLFKGQEDIQSKALLTFRPPLGLRA